MERKILVSILMVFLVSCSQGGFVEPIASTISTPETTYIPVTATRTRVGQYDMLDGVSKISNLVLKVDGEKNTTSLQGMITLQPMEKGAKALQIPLDIAGTINPDDFTSFMRATNQTQLDALSVQVGAKLTCLYTDCSESFIDIYVNYQGRIYHHQVESTEKLTVKPLPSPAVAEGPSQSPSPTLTPAPEADEDSMDTEGSEFEHDDGEGDLGAYVGEPERDVEVLFPVAPVQGAEDKKSNPAGPKKEDPKNTATEPPTPKKETPSKPVVPTKTSGDVSIGRRLLDRISQAIGDNSNGRLENAANILKLQQEQENPGFNIMHPKRETYYGTNDMLSIVAQIGQFSHKNANGYVLSVGDISRKSGGRLGGHASHRRGLDADIAYYFDNKSFQKGFVNVMASTTTKRSWMSEKQWELFKSLVATSNVDRIFTDAKMKRELCEIATRNSEVDSNKEGVAFETLRALNPWSGHANHFHLRLKCSKAQPRCRQMAPPPKTTGC